MARSDRVPGSLPIIASTFGRPGAEQLRFELVAGDAHHECRAPVMARIDDAAQLIVVLDEGVHLVDEQRRLVLLDDAKDGGWRRVGANTPFGTRLAMTLSVVVLPQRFSGESSARIGEH